MTKLVLALLLISTPGFCQSMKSAQKAGKDFGKQESAAALKISKQISFDDLLPSDMQGKTFDGEHAKLQIKQQKRPTSETLDFLLSEEVQRNEKNNKGFHEDEYFLKRSEEIARAAHDQTEEITEDKDIKYNFYTCKQSGAPFVVTLIRELKVEVVHQPKVKTKHKFCKGHEIKESYYWKSDAKHAAHKYEKNLSEDPTVKSYEVDYKGGWTKDYKLIVTWTHHKDTKKCDHYKYKIKVEKEESWTEEGDQWIYDNPALIPLSQSPDCTLIEQACIDSEPTKVIEGKEVKRKCWKEKLSFLYQFPLVKDCLSLKQQNCTQTQQHCLQATPFGCALWEITFKCFSQIIKTRKIVGAETLFGLDQSEWETEYSPNNSFADVAIKLSVFDEIKKELEKTNSFDASQISIFKGVKTQCSKNVSGDLLYDCCFSYGGVATKIGLSKCNSDEIALAEMREKGLCHYVGSYEEKMLDLWKSRDEHVFCCFPSKLSRVVQEEGKKQLKQGWGEPKQPRCNGFTFEEISELDFTNMDLSEAFDQLPHDLSQKFEDKLSNFQNRLENELKKEPQK